MYNDGSVNAFSTISQNTSKTSLENNKKKNKTCLAIQRVMVPPMSVVCRVTLKNKWDPLECCANKGNCFSHEGVCREERSTKHTKTLATKILEHV